jgi:hypothetical protein
MGNDVMYSDATGNFLIQGALIDVKQKRQAADEHVRNIPLLQEREQFLGAGVKGIGIHRRVWGKESRHSQDGGQVLQRAAPVGWRRKKRCFHERIMAVGCKRLWRLLRLQAR